MAELFDSLAGRTRFTHNFCPVFNCNLYRPEATSDVISSNSVDPIVPDKLVKFGDPNLNLSRKIPSEAVYFRPFYNFDNCQREAVSDVLSGVTVQDGGMDTRANFGDSRLKPSKASF